MLKELIEKGYGDDLKLNCAEKILYASNETFKLGLNPEALKLVAGFGGGMAIESVCGALTGGIMVLGRLFKPQNVEDKEKFKSIIQDYLEAYRKEMGEIYCAPLKDKYRTEENGCYNVIVKSAEVLEAIIEKEKSK